MTASLTYVAKFNGPLFRKNCWCRSTASRALRCSFLKNLELSFTIDWCLQVCISVYATFRHCIPVLFMRIILHYFELFLVHLAEFFNEFTIVFAVVKSLFCFVWEFLCLFVQKLFAITHIVSIRKAVIYNQAIWVYCLSSECIWGIVDFLIIISEE